MFINNGGVGECSIVSCLHCQHYHCLYSDICYNIIRKRKENKDIKERLEERNNNESIGCM